MTYRRVSKEEAHRMFDILVEHCGASEDDRMAFVINFCENSHFNDEFDCVPSLGENAKFKYSDGKFYVKGQFMTAEREEKIQKANSLISKVIKNLN